MATLELDKISKQYSKDSWGLRETSLSVNDREFLVLLGPSGCGKSTTVRLIAGLEDITSGRIFIGDTDVTWLPPRKRNISMVFQSYAVWPHMTVFDNIAFALKLKRIPRDEIEKTVREMSEMVNISDYLKRYPSQLSGGQRQRVALARALAVKPQVFLMDEPLSNLDAKLRMQMRTELKAIHQQTEATTLFVTHDQAEAMSIADRIVIMKDGEIVQIGTPEEVYSQCANTFVAGFIGSPPANFFKMRIEKDEKCMKLVNPEFSFTPGQAWHSCLEKAGLSEVILAVRPEDIALTHKADAILSREVLVVEPQGTHQILVVEINGNLSKIRVPNTPIIKPGEHIHLVFNRERLHLFHPKTEKRV